MIAGQFVSACPPIARDSASCCISSRRAPLVAFIGVCLSVKEGRISGRTNGPRERSRGPGWLGCRVVGFVGVGQIAGLRGLIAGAAVVLVALQEPVHPRDVV